MDDADEVPRDLQPLLHLFIPAAIFRLQQGCDIPVGESSALGTQRAIVVKSQIAVAQRLIFVAPYGSLFVVREWRALGIGKGTQKLARVSQGGLEFAGWRP